MTLHSTITLASSFRPPPSTDLSNTTPLADGYCVDIEFPSVRSSLNASRTRSPIGFVRSPEASASRFLVSSFISLLSPGFSVFLLVAIVALNRTVAASSWCSETATTLKRSCGTGWYGRTAETRSVFAALTPSCLPRAAEPLGNRDWTVTGSGFTRGYVTVRASGLIETIAAVWRTASFPSSFWSP